MLLATCPRCNLSSPVPEVFAGAAPCLACGQPIALDRGDCECRPDRIVEGG
jgi:hypothetical protein